MRLNVRRFLPFILALSTISSTAQTTLFFDNCNTMANWTNTGRIYPANSPGYNWMSVDPTVPTDDHTGGGNCLYVNGNSNYATAGAGNYILYRINSSPVNLTGWTNTRLEFWMQMRSETGNWDGGFVDWSHDGVNWTQLTTELCVPYDGNMSQNASSTPFYPYLKPAWFNPRTTWTRVLANLSAIDNVPSFYLRFTFHSDEEAQDRGWAIDDIKIVSVAQIRLEGNNLVIPGGNVPTAANNTDFGACSVGAFIDKEFFIHNIGESPLTLTGTPLVTTTGAGFFVLTQPSTNVIPPGDSIPFTVRFLPAAIGTVNGTISIPHSDTYSACGVVNPFVYNIRATGLNTPPTISAITDTGGCPGAGPITLPFIVGDMEQNPNVITVSGTSSDQTILPNANISFSGTGTDRNVTFTGAPGQTGTVTVTVTANDGQPSGNTTSTTFDIVFGDTEPPVALCQNITLQLDNAGQAALTAQQVDAGSTDNCLLGQLVIPQTAFSCADVGIQNFTMDVFDALQNVSQCPFTVTVLPPPGLLQLSAPEFTGGKEISCKGASDGTINANAQGGCGPYTYAWLEAPANTGDQLLNQPAGTYHVSATDAAGQVFTAEITLEEPTELVNASTGQNVTCFGKADGRATLAVTGATAPYTYSGGPDITGLPAGTYNYTATDANGCTLPITFTILEPTEIVLNVAPLVAVQCGEEIPLSAEAFNGTGAFTYSWTGPGVTCTNCGVTSAIASESAVYEVVATDQNGCYKNAQTLAQVDCNVYIPNAFTPNNGDMLNPLFRVYTGTVDQYSFSVFDRWGQVMYQSQNPDDGWNGHNGKKMAAQGVYVYKLIYRFPGGKENILMGSVTLLSGN